MTADTTIQVIIANVQKASLVFFQNQAGQTAGRIGGRVNPDSIGANLRSDRRRVTVDDKFSVFSLTGQEWLSDIEKIVAILTIERHAWSHSGMTEEVIANDRRNLKRF